MRRLDAPTLVLHAQTFTRVLASADERTCAALVMGKASESTLLAAFRTADLETMDAWFDVTYRAAVAEASETGQMVTLSESEIREAFTALGRHLPTAEAAQVHALLTVAGTMNDEDICTAGRRLYDGALTLAAPARDHVIRALLKTPTSRHDPWTTRIRWHGEPRAELPLTAGGAPG